jgi:hypothetical protein
MRSFWVEPSLYWFLIICLYLYCCWRSNIKIERIGILWSSLALPNFRVWPKQGPEFPTSRVVPLPSLGVCRRPSVVRHKLSHLNLLLWNRWTKLNLTWQGWSLCDPFKIVSDSSALHSRWLLLLKIEISSIFHCCYSLSQNELKYFTAAT